MRFVRGHHNRTPKYREINSAHKRGGKLTEDHKAKIAAGMRAHLATHPRVISPDTRAKQAASLRGRKLSEAHKAKIADSQRGPKSHFWKGTPAERFASYVGEPDANGCLPWLGRLQRGYGKFSLGSRPSRSFLAHRFAYELTHGPIPSGLELHHRCENPSCVNADHLVAITRADHIRLHASQPDWGFRQRVSQILAERR